MDNAYCSYDGEFLNGRFHGKGRWICKFTQNVYDGEFHNGIYHGEGYLINEGTGETIRATWNNGQPHGDAVVTLKNGRSERRVYDNGDMISCTPMTMKPTKSAMNIR